jgi:hypothetical protein
VAVPVQQGRQCGRNARIGLDDVNKRGHGFDTRFRRGVDLDLK